MVLLLFPYHTLCGAGESSLNYHRSQVEGNRKGRELLPARGDGSEPGLHIRKLQTSPPLFLSACLPACLSILKRFSIRVGPRATQPMPSSGVPHALRELVAIRLQLRHRVLSVFSLVNLFQHQLESAICFGLPVQTEGEKWTNTTLTWWLGSSLIPQDFIFRHSVLKVHKSRFF